MGVVALFEVKIETLVVGKYAVEHQCKTIVRF